MGEQENPTVDPTASTARDNAVAEISTTTTPVGDAAHVSSGTSYVVPPNSPTFLTAAMLASCKSTQDKLKVGYTYWWWTNAEQEHGSTWTAAQYRDAWLRADQAWADSVVTGWMSSPLPQSELSRGEQFLESLIPHIAGSLAKEWPWAAPLIDTPVTEALSQTIIANKQDAFDFAFRLWNPAKLDDLGARFQQTCQQNAACNEGFTLAFPDLRTVNGGFVGDGGIAELTPAEIVTAKPALFPAGAAAGAQADGSVNLPVMGHTLELYIGPALNEATAEITGQTFGIADDFAKYADQQLKDLGGWVAGSAAGSAAAHAALEQRRKEVSQTIDASIQAASGALHGISAIARVFDPKLGADIDRIGSAVIGTATAAKGFVDAVEQFEKVGGAISGLGAAAATGNVIGAVFSLISVFNSGPDPQEMILQQVGAIRTDIAQLGDMVSDRFDQVDQELNAIYSNISGQLRAIDLTTEHVEVDVLAVQDMLISQAVTLQRLDDQLVNLLQTESRRDLQKAIDDGIGWTDRHTEPMPHETFLQVTETFHNYAAAFAYDPLETDGGANRPVDDTSLAHELTSRPLHFNVGYLNDYLAAKNWPTFANDPEGNRTLPNPFTWATAANAFTSVCFENADQAATLTSQFFDEMMAGGEALDRAFTTIQNSPQLLSQLQTNYSAKIDAFAAAFETAAGENVRTLSGRPAPDPNDPGSGYPLLNAWGAPDQPLDGFTPIKLTSIAHGSSQLTMPKAIAAGVPNVYRNHDWRTSDASGSLSASITAEWTNQKQVVNDHHVPVTRANMLATITVTFANTPVGRWTIKSTETTDWEQNDPPDPDSMLDSFWPNIIGIAPTPLPLTGAEEQAETAVRASATANVAAAMDADRRSTYTTLISRVQATTPVEGDDLVNKAIQLTGSKALLDSVFALGFSLSRTYDDLTRALFDGAPRSAGGIGLPDQQILVAELAIAGDTHSPVIDPHAGSASAWIKNLGAQPTQFVGALISARQANARTGTFEFVESVRQALLRLRIINTLIHPVEEDIVSQLPTVSQGSPAPLVRRVQGLLRASFPQLTDHTLPLNGTFGPITTSHVKQLQASSHLPQTGTVDEATWKVLLGVTA